MGKEQAKLYQKISLINRPVPADKENISDIISKLEGKDPQINLGIKIQKDNPIRKFSRHLHLWFQVVHVNPYWKNFSSVAMIISAILSSGLLLGIYIINYNSLPANIPLIFNHAINGWKYIPKDNVLFIPIIHLVIIAISQRINLVIFKFDRRLVQVINESLILFNIIYIIIILEIYTMLLVY
jgi:hypothetical protein